MDENELLARVWSLGEDYHRLAGEHCVASELLCMDAGVRAGQHVVDIACGTGNTALSAARRRAVVKAIDVTPRLIERARQRTQAEGLEGIEYHVGDANSMPYEDAAFDVSLSSFGVAFLPDHQRAMDEMLRVTRPGGTLGLTLWSNASVPSDLYYLGKDLGISPERPGVEPAFMLGQGDYLQKILGDRVTGVHIRPGSLEVCYRSIEQYVETLITCHGPAVARMQKATPEVREAYKAGIARIVQRYNRAADGTFACAYDYLTVIATKR